MGENNWDLQAVVRSCVEPTAAQPDRDPFAFFCSSPALGVDADHDMFVPDPPSVTLELEELYKPFFRSPLIPPSQPPASQEEQGRRPPTFFRQQQRQSSFSEPARSKKRKKQQKKVVRQVPIDVQSTDVWAWRKYGQKPIKGSPYPRGYYKCSTSKGCPARKQVERNRTDPGVLLVTYTAEHNHPIPTHRNTLAGSVRHKPNPANPKVNVDGVNMENVNEAPSSSAAPEVEGEEDGEGMLLETDIGMLGVDDDALFEALDGLGRSTPERATSAAGSPEQFTSMFSSP